MLSIRAITDPTRRLWLSLFPPSLLLSRLALLLSQLPLLLNRLPLLLFLNLRPRPSPLASLTALPSPPLEDLAAARQDLGRASS